ncbi:MAG: C25 family cysteine peptidase [Thermoproteota archaeon]
MISGTQYGEIELTVGCNIPRILPYGEYVLVELDDFYTSIDPGNPQLPFKTLDVLLPPNVDTGSVSVQILQDKSLEMNVTKILAPAPPLVCNEKVEWGEDKEICDGKNLLVYGKDEYYPDRAVALSEISNRGIYVFARIRYNPIQYKPLSGKLRINEKVVFKIAYSLTQQPSNMIRNRVMEEVAREQFVNWDTAKEWYSQTLQISDSKYDYIIVTTNAIKVGSSKLNQYMDFLASRGFKVKVITEVDYATGTNNNQGQNRSINIRNWLKNNYQTMGIKYVLLIGNPDPDDPSDPSDLYGDVPMMMCWPRRGAGSDEVAPTDYFYADLTGNWDSDGDGYYGEYGQDYVDFTPEVYVGRIPVYGGDYSALDGILQKFMNYGSSGTSWRYRIMMPVAISNYKNEDDSGWPATNGTDLPKYVIENILPIGWSHYVMYERAGLIPMPESSPYYSAPLSRNNVVNEWKKGYGVVFWCGHGNYAGAYRKYWNVDDGDGIPESTEMNWEIFFGISDASLLNNSRPSFVYQCSCDNGYPENQNSLGYVLLKTGAIATVSASRVSWYIIGYWRPRSLADNVEIGYRYFEKLLKDRRSAGVALYEAKQMLPRNSREWCMNLFVFNLYGDPSFSIFNTAVNITVDSEPRGLGFVKVDGQPILTPASFAWFEGSTHLLEAVSPINLGNGTRLVWKNWSDGEAQIHSYVVPSSDAVVKAFFTRQYNVTFKVKPPGCGTVTPLGSGWYNESSTIQISATPDPDCVFRNWFTDTSKITITNPNLQTTTATINGPGTVTANFTVTVTSLTLRLVNSTVKAGVINLTVKIISPKYITGAEYAVDDTTSPTTIPSPVDGSWDSSIEFVRISFNGSTYANGYHTIYVRAYDIQETSDWITTRFYIRDLVKYYNLIAFIFRPPLGYSAKDVAEAIGINAVNHIDRWNSTSQKYESYVPSSSKPKNFLMEEGFGYFVFLTSPKKFIEVGMNEYG